GDQNMFRGRGVFTTTGSQPIVIEDNGGTADILQFYTHSDDPQAAADEQVFVRYFVNRQTQMACRQVIRKAAADPYPETTVDPAGYTFEDKTSNLAVYNEV